MNGSSSTSFLSGSQLWIGFGDRNQICSPQESNTRLVFGEIDSFKCSSVTLQSSSGVAVFPIDPCVALSCRKHIPLRFHALSNLLQSLNHLDEGPGRGVFANKRLAYVSGREVLGPSQPTPSVRQSETPNTAEPWYFAHPVSSLFVRVITRVRPIT